MEEEKFTLIQCQHENSPSPSPPTELIQSNELFVTKSILMALFTHINK